MFFLCLCMWQLKSWPLTHPIIGFLRFCINPTTMGTLRERENKHPTPRYNFLIGLTRISQPTLGRGRGTPSPPYVISGLCDSGVARITDWGAHLHFLIKMSDEQKIVVFFSIMLPTNQPTPLKKRFWANPTTGANQNRGLRGYADTHRYLSVFEPLWSTRYVLDPWKIHNVAAYNE